MKFPHAHHLLIPELAGQMLIPAVSVRFINRYSAQVRRLTRLIQQYYLGGIILFDTHPTDVHFWIQHLQKVVKIPLLISANFERGVGGIFEFGTTLPHALAWGATNDISIVRDAASVIAQEAKVIGVNTIFAPVLDLVKEPENPIINIRGFHSDPEKVADTGVTFIKTIQKQGIACVAKHFPGHGRALSDSHLVLPKIEATLEDLRKSDLLPFQQAIKSGVKGIMSAHIQLKNRRMPVTFDSQIIKDELRKKLKFPGLIFSDALNMRAISDNFSTIEQLEQGLKAGLDIFVMPQNIPKYHTLLCNLLSESSQLKQVAQLNVERIFSLKKWIHQHNPETVHHARLYKILELPKHIAISHQIADKAVTCVHKAKNFPLDLKKIRNCSHLIFTDFQPTEKPLIILQRRLSDFFNSVKTHINPKSREYKANGNKWMDLSVISLYSRTFGGHTSQFQWKDIHHSIKEATIKSKYVVLLVFGNPYHLTQLKEINKIAAVFILYSYVQSSQNAAFKAICSFLPVQGILPMKLGLRTKSLKIPEKFYSIEISPKIFSQILEVDNYIIQSIKKKYFPGGILLLIHNGKKIYSRAYGRFDYQSDSTDIKLNTPYDLASLTKILVTTPIILKLCDEEKINLTDKLYFYYAELKKHLLGQATIQDLLAHQAGLVSWKPFYSYCKNKNEIIRDILKSDLQYKKGEKSIYSDLGFILLGNIIELITGKRLDEYYRDKFSHQLGLSSLHFLPNPGKNQKQSKLFPSRIHKYPPTGYEKYRDRIIQSEVNDTNCYVMGGVAGHAGLFGTADDVSAIAQLFLNKGIYNRTRILKYDSTDRAIQRVNPVISNRALGWDTWTVKSNVGKFFSRESFGHFAFTGPSLWVDPRKNLIITFLCNRTHPDPSKNHMDTFRAQLHDLIIQFLSKKKKFKIVTKA